MYKHTESHGPRALQRWILMQFGEELVLYIIVHRADLALVEGGYSHRGGSSWSDHFAPQSLNLGSQSQSPCAMPHSF
jgi:hypothetical protein